jgi:hypothetical protein
MELNSKLKFNSLPSCGLNSFEYGHIIRDRHAAHIEYAGPVSFCELHFTRLAAQLHGAKNVHGNPGGANRVPF